MTEPDAPEDDRELVLTDDDFLTIVQEQRRQSVGFGFANDYELFAEREKALNYAKGEMPDVPVLENRSAAVSTDISEAVETVTPDLIEILINGEDVVAFAPHSKADVSTAKQETAYIRHVFLEDNPGFLILTSATKDALVTKLAVVKFWWEGGKVERSQRVEGQTAVQLMQAHALAAQAGASIEDIEQRAPESPIALPTYDFTLSWVEDKGRPKVMGVPSDDFTVAQDTVTLTDCTYCAMKSRPRVQDLIAQGYDRATVEDLPAYSGHGTAQTDEALNLARDTAGEHLAGSTLETTHTGLKVVEVVEHYVRVDADDDGAPELWKVVTGGNESVFLSKERVARLPFAVWTPYLVPYRLYGRSLADVLLEVQRIKTALLRMLLDSGYFALNQRAEVAMDKANQWTLTDLMRNSPAMPIRSKTGDAVRPVQAGALAFDVQAALEYVAVMGEQRSGVKRHSMGLNPDTLHDTASGALGQLNEAMKRVRFMARVIAETGLRDLFLGLHALIRENASSVRNVLLGGQWADIDPSQWPERETVKVDIGPQKDQKLAALQMLGGWMEKIVEAQQGMNGPIITADKVTNLLDDLADAAGIKGDYFPEPEQVQQAMQQAASQPPKPDPKAEADKAKAQNDAQRLQLQAQDADAAHQREQARLQLDAERFQFEQKAHADKIALEHRKLDLAALGVHVDAQGDAQDRELKAREAAERTAADRERSTQQHVAAMAGIAERHQTAVQTTGMKIGADLAIQASEERDTELEQDAPDADGKPTWEAGE